LTDLTIVSVNPLEHAREIKDLFRVHDHPEFAEFFDRAYAAAVRRGARSWVGVNGSRQIVMHSARFLRRFSFADREVTGGLMVNLMVARSHRAFIPAARLMARVVQETKREGAVDFLYTDPNESGRAVSVAGGFRPVGTLDRFVLPISHRRWAIDRALRVYQMGLRLFGDSRLVCTAHPARAFDPAPYERPPARSTRLRPFHPPALFAERLAGYPRHDDHWLTFRPVGANAGEACTVALLRGPDGKGKATLHSLWREPTLSLSRIVSPIVGWLRARRALQLCVVTMSGTGFARELRRSGFVARHDLVPLVALPLTETGRRVVAAARDWELMAVDCDLWDVLPDPSAAA
jgi:hypothetical protein